MSFACTSCGKTYRQPRDVPDEWQCECGGLVVEVCHHGVQIGHCVSCPRICSFKNCPHPARASGLCASHYQQKRRGELLTALRSRNDSQPMERVSLRLSPPTAAAVRDDGAGARGALDEWREKKEGKR